MNLLWRWPMQPVAILCWLLRTYLFWQTAAWYAIGHVAAMAHPGLGGSPRSVSTTWRCSGCAMPRSCSSSSRQHTSLHAQDAGDRLQVRTARPATNRKSFTSTTRSRTTFSGASPVGTVRPSSRRCCFGSMPGHARVRRLVDGADGGRDPVHRGRALLRQPSPAARRSALLGGSTPSTTAT